jgi:hypothetical protein
VPIVLLGGDDAERSPEDAARLDDPEVVDSLSRTVADAVIRLRDRSPA